jgi:hypothetical protein
MKYKVLTRSVIWELVFAVLVLLLVAWLRRW